MSAPRIAFIFSALNKKELRLATSPFANQNRNRRPASNRVLDLRRRSRFELCLETRNAKIAAKALHPVYTTG